MLISTTILASIIRHSAIQTRSNHLAIPRTMVAAASMTTSKMPLRCLLQYPLRPHSQPQLRHLHLLQERPLLVSMMTFSRHLWRHSLRRRKLLSAAATSAQSRLMVVFQGTICHRQADLQSDSKRSRHGQARRLCPRRPSNSKAVLHLHYLRAKNRMES